MENLQVVVLDGHDGAGKSTLARALASAIGADVVKPFSDSLGDHIAWFWRHDRFDEADALARSSIERIMLEQDPTRGIVFDRHWVSLFTVLPERYWSNWAPLPRTIVCHADPLTTQRRLSERGEDPLTVDHHGYYEQRYVALARRFHALDLDTSALGPEETLAAALDFVNL